MTFKQIVKAVTTVVLRARPNPIARGELEEFLDSTLEVFQAHAKTPSHTILASLVMHQHFPELTKVFTNALAFGCGIELPKPKQESKTYGKTHS